MNERELRQLIEKVGKLASSETKKAKSKSMVCSVDLGLVVLQVTMGLN